MSNTEYLKQSGMDDEGETSSNSKSQGIPYKLVEHDIPLGYRFEENF